MNPLSDHGRQVLATLARHRRVVAALAVATAVAAGLQAVAPAGAATVPVLAAARDLGWGDPLRAGDLQQVRLPADAVPDGALEETAVAVGRLLASPVRRGEPITDVRLVGPGLLDGHDADGDLLAVPVRVADPGAAALIGAGDTVDVLAAPADAFAAEAEADSGPVALPADVVAGDVRVLAVPSRDAAGAVPSAEGALLVVAASSSQAARLARAQATSRLSIAVRGSG